MIKVAAALVGIDLLDGDVSYIVAENIVIQFASTLGGEFGEKIGMSIVAGLSFELGGAAAPIGGTIGDEIGSSIAENGIEYTFDCLFSEGINGDLVFDAEFQLLIEKINESELTDVGEIIDNVSDVFF